MGELDTLTLTQAYIHNISCINTRDLFMSNLPSFYYDSSLDIIYKILKYLEDELNYSLELKKQLIEDEEIEIVNAEIESISNKINWIRETLEKEKQESDKEEQALTNNHEKNIIFATNSREPYILSDLKNIPEEYYEKVMSCLERLQAGDSDYNEEKQRKMTTINTKLKGLHELKEFKIRLLYKVIDGSTVYVTQVIMKKDDFSKKTKEDMIKRNEVVADEYERVKQSIKNIEVSDKLITSNKEILDDVLKYLDTNKRGEGSVKK